jgi:capsular exopolysaccharide synthesis family protein
MKEHIRDIDHPQEQTFNYQEFLYKCYHYWYLFAISVLLALVISFFFNKYARPVYEVKSTVLIKDRSENKINPQEMLGIGRFNNMQNLQNEIEILSSYSLVNRTIQKTGCEVSYFSSDKFLYREFYRQNPLTAIKRFYNGNPFYTSSELFREAPFKVIMDTSFPQPVNMTFNLTFLSPTQYKIEADAEDVLFYDFAHKEFVKDRRESVKVNNVYSFQQVVQQKDFRFKIILTANFDEKRDYNKSFSFMFRDYEGLVTEFRTYTVEPAKKDASVVVVTMQGTRADKAADFIDALTSEYLISGLEKKNLVATRTINFIDKELMGISDSLNTSERVLMNFRTNKEVMNLDAQSQQVFEKMMELQDEKAVLLVKNSYLKNLKKYIETNQKLDEMIVPASMGIDNAVLNGLTGKLTELYMKRSESALYAKDKSPSVVLLDSQIESTKNALYENTCNALNSNEMAIGEIDKRMAGINARISNLPETQRVLFGIERKFKLIDASYTFLLQKRSEAQITRAANTPDNEIIDKAYNSGFTLIFPSKGRNTLIALLLGLLFPILYILGKDYFNKTIITREDIEKITQLPFLGNLLHSKKGSRVVIDAPNSTSTEAFRTVRTNINYLLQRKERQTILITSDMVGAGKTFVSVNLASIFALYGKKTLLMGFDLRKPRIFDDFKLNNTTGISSYLINKDNLEAVIRPSGVDNLDILMAGPIPPNPAELIASQKCSELFERLKEIYEYIIIDTPPVALVTDAFLLMKHSDANLMVVRQGVTNKKLLASVIRDMELHETPKLAIVLNDYSVEQGSYGYGYGYGYGHGYGYGYYSDDPVEDDERKSLLTRFFTTKTRRRK